MTASLQLNKHVSHTMRTLDPTLQTLTPREKDIVEFSCAGLVPKQIACSMHWSLGSVKVYISRLLHKSNAPGMHELACAVLNLRIYELNGRIVVLEHDAWLRRQQESGPTDQQAEGVLVQTKEEVVHGS